jgi:hypothetical protein
LVCSAVSEEWVCNSSATCISHTISHRTTQSSIHLRLVQEIRAERVESWSAPCIWCSCGPCSGLLLTQPTKINAASESWVAATTNNRLQNPT